LQVTGWAGGGTYGIRIGRANAARYFLKAWSAVEIQVGEKFHRYPLSNTFWTSCPELRSGAIKQWLARQGLAPWPHRTPPKLVLTPLGGNRFRLGVP
jgi:hypothetical protein